MKKIFRNRFTAIVATLVVAAGTSSAFAVSTGSLFFNINAGDPGSYSASTPTVWTDLSASGRNGTIFGSVTESGGALVFPGSVNGYVDMGSGYSNFGTGITIEFEAHFGTTGNLWERIFDFGNAAGVDNIWVGSYSTSSEVVIELWKPNPTTQTGIGRCRAATGTNSIQANTFKKYVVTLDGATCRIYINGTEVNTVIDGPAKGSVAGQNSSYDVFYDDPSRLGSAYPALPSVVNRTKNYIGKSNWSADAAFDGAIKYVRIYTEALSPTDVTNNAATYTLAYSTTGSDSGTAPSSRTGNGLISLDGNTGTLAKTGHVFAGWAASANQATAISGSYNLAANTTLYPAFAPNTYNVTYDEQGGSTVSDGTFTHGGSLTYPVNPSKSGYTFLGWFANATGGSALTASSVAAGNTSTTLHAQWAIASANNSGTTNNSPTATGSGTSSTELAKTGFDMQSQLISALLLILLGFGLLKVTRSAR